MMLQVSHFHPHAHVLDLEQPHARVREKPTASCAMESLGLGSRRNNKNNGKSNSGNNINTGGGTTTLVNNSSTNAGCGDSSHHPHHLAKLHVHSMTHSKLKNMQSHQYQHSHSHQPANQNYYTQQQSQLQRLKQQQKLQQQQHKSQGEDINAIKKGVVVGMGMPKHNAGYLQFPPPPDYPPPASTSPQNKSADSSPVAVADIVSSNLAPGVGATGVVINSNGRRHLLPRYPDPDPDAIEICNDQQELSPHHLKKLAHRSKTLGRDGNVVDATKWMTLQQHHVHHQHHDYSYAYYEPGAAMRHSNVPKPDNRGESAGPDTNSTHCATATPLTGSGQPPPNSIRALLSKGKKNKQLVSSATLQSFHKTLTAINQSENLYEEINAATLQTSSTETGTTQQQPQLRCAVSSHSAGSLSQTLVDEELRRVQYRHHKILGELNLSVEAMLMPESPHKSSPHATVAVCRPSVSTDMPPKPSPTVCVTAVSGLPIIPAMTNSCLTSTSAGNICDSSDADGIEQLLATLKATTTTTCDLDSGFSGSSGASYIGNLRLTKTQHTKCARQTPTASAAYATQSCRFFQRSTANDESSITVDSVTATNSNFLTRASCGRRILTCARIRAAEDPGPSVPTESKARSFWNHKSWRKLPGISASTTSINDTDLTDTDDIPSTGRPNDAVIPENVEKTLKIIMSDRKVKVREIADILKISAGSVHTIIHEHLGMKKVFSKWVPRLLTPEQKQQRIDESKSCLDMFTRNKSEFLRRYITMDETWIHHFTPESNRQSAEWHAAGESRPKRPKTQQLAGKVMASVFWDAHGIIFIDYLQKGQTINSDYYMALLERLKRRNRKETASYGEEKSVVPPRQCTVSQINENNGKIERIGLRIASPSTVFSRFGPQRLLALRRPQKDAPW
ncbi:hypothetical protein ACLKA6_010344 [Drosophila palustris]